MTRTIEAIAVLNPGEAEASIVRLDEPLSFWGGFDPTDGRILDRSHPQAGLSIAGAILAMPRSRGSAGTPGGVAESLRRGVGPVGFVLLAADVNIAIGAQVADRLYDTRTPVVTVCEADYRLLITGLTASITSDGRISIA